MNNGNGQLTRPQPKPRRGELTGPQSRAMMSQIRSGAGWLNALKGYEEADKKFPPRYPNWVEMLHTPTIALGYAVKTSPILATMWTWKVRACAKD